MMGPGGGLEKLQAVSFGAEPTGLLVVMVVVVLVVGMRRKTR